MLGTLREILIYPHNDTVDDSLVIEALQKINLVHIAEMLNENCKNLAEI